MYLGTEVVDTDHREIRDGLPWFLDEPENPAVGSEDSDSQRRWVVHPPQQNLRRSRLLAEPVGVGDDPAAEEVVPEKHAEG
jgi:hypothetical protein